MRFKQNIKLQTVNRENLPAKDLKKILGGIRKCKEYACQCNDDRLSFSIASAEGVAGNESKAFLNPDPLG